MFDFLVTVKRTEVLRELQNNILSLISSDIVAQTIVYTCTYLVSSLLLVLTL